MRLALPFAVLVLVLVLAGTVTFAPPSSAAAPATAPASQPSEVVRKALSAVVPRFQLKNVELQTALDSIKEWVEQSTEAKVDIRWRYITRAGYHPTMNVSIDLRNATVEKILQTLLKDMDGPSRRLLYRAEGDSIVITSMLDN